MSKGVVDYFVAFLVGGLVLLLALTALFSFVQIPSDQKGITPTPSREFFTPYHFAFDISKLREEKSFYLGNLNVSNGILFGNQDVKYSITSEDAIDLRISFSVSGSNFYLPLIIKVNGNQIVGKPLYDGEHSFVVKNSTKEMRIEIGTESSSWRLWAPSLYKLSSVKFDLGRFSDVTREFRFNATGKVTRGGIDFTFSENEGIFIFRLNNNTIYTDAVNDIKSIELAKNSFISGINRLVLMADDNSRFRGTAVLAVVYEA